MSLHEQPGIGETETAHTGPSPWATVALTGEIDLATTPPLLATLADASRLPGSEAGVIVDLTAVEFIDVTGLNALIATHHRLRSSDRDLVVRNPSPTFLRMLDLFGLAEIAEHTDDPQARRLAC